MSFFFHSSSKTIALSILLKNCDTHFHPILQSTQGSLRHVCGLRDNLYSSRSLSKGSVLSLFLREREQKYSESQLKLRVSTSSLRNIPLLRVGPRDLLRILCCRFHHFAIFEMLLRCNPRINRQSRADEFNATLDRTDQLYTPMIRS